MMHLESVVLSMFLIMIICFSLPHKMQYASNFEILVQVFSGTENELLNEYLRISVLQVIIIGTNSLRIFYIKRV